MEQARVKYPIGIQDFEGLRKDGYLYVDKTEIIYQLVTQSKYIFLSRPRRFGKSLLLSTIKAYFEGKKELFEGLAIESLEKEWKEYPVLMLELSRTTAFDSNSLEELLAQQFSIWEKQYGVVEKSESMSARFANIIINAHETTGERVVVLVDEYDNALINTLHDRELHERNKELLKSVYSNLKALDAHIKFGMLTGVSRFSHMSIFSGLNNLDDITLSDDYCVICGITPEELQKYFRQGIEEMSQNLEMDYSSVLNDLKKFYDGYHFSKNCRDVYNPFSLLNAFNKRELGSYWMQTGTPTFLVKRIIEEKLDLNDLFHSQATEQALGDADLSYTSLVALLFQTGYLTIKGYEPRRRRYKLGIPNMEVSEGLFENLMKVSQYKDSERGRDIIYAMSDSLYEGNPERALEKMKVYLGGIGYPQGHADKEFAFENNLLIPLKLLAMDVHSELHISSGRIDMVVKTDRYIYVFEFKLDGSAEEALKQIEEKEYALPFESDGRKIYKIGVNFSSKKRNIDSWIIR